MELVSAHELPLPHAASWMMFHWVDGDLDFGDGCGHRRVEASARLVSKYFCSVLRDLYEVLEDGRRIDLFDFLGNVPRGPDENGSVGIIQRIERDPAGGADDLRLTGEPSDGLTRLAAAMGAPDFKTFCAAHENSPDGLSCNPIMGEEAAVGNLVEAGASAASGAVGRSRSGEVA